MYILNEIKNNVEIAKFTAMEKSTLQLYLSNRGYIYNPATDTYSSDTLSKIKRDTEKYFSIKEIPLLTK